MNYTGSSFSLLKSSFLSSVWKNCVSIFFILLVLPLWGRIHSKTFFCSLSHISSYEIVPMQNQHVTNFTSTEIKVEKNRVMWPKGLCKEYLGNSLLLKGLSLAFFFSIFLFTWRFSSFLCAVIQFLAENGLGPVMTLALEMICHENLSWISQPRTKLMDIQILNWIWILWLELSEIFVAVAGDLDLIVLAA